MNVPWAGNLMHGRPGVAAATLEVQGSEDSRRLPHQILAPQTPAMG